jgi:hypothetical protein
MISESFVGDRWSYVASKFAKSIAGQTSNDAFANLYESLIDTLVSSENTRNTLKGVLLENSWNREGKKILGMIIVEEKSELGQVDERIYENSNCSFKKNLTPLLKDDDKIVFNLNGKNYLFDGNTMSEVNVTDRRYCNVLEGLNIMKYEADKDRLVYYGKNNMVLEYDCTNDKIGLTGVEDINDRSIIEIYETLKKCGIFDRDTIKYCEPLVKFFESKDMLKNLDIITTVQHNNFAGLFVSVISVNEGVYVNKVNKPMGYNELVLCENAKKACDVIKDFMKYDATVILEDRLKLEGEQQAIIESERNEIKDTLSFLNEERNKLISAIQETNNDGQLKEALKLVESEIHKFEKKLQESYNVKKK